MSKIEELSSQFSEWLTRGPGESFYGGILKAAASRQKRELRKRLETASLFPHLEHEDRAAIEKADQVWHEGDKRVRRCRARTKAISGILDADAGLQISADDLEPPK